MGSNDSLGQEVKWPKSYLPPVDLGLFRRSSWGKFRAWRRRRRIQRLDEEGARLRGEIEAAGKLLRLKVVPGWILEGYIENTGKLEAIQLKIRSMIDGN